MTDNSQKNQKDKLIRVVLLGDSNVGKSSLISACVSEDYTTLTGGNAAASADSVDRKKKVLAPILLPSETALDDCNTILVDTDGSESSEEANKKSVRHANSILLLYDMSSEDSVDRLETYWLPMIAESNPQIPVIIVGSKLDTIRNDFEVSYYTRISKLIRPLMRKFRQVEIGIECSAKDLKNVIETLYCAQMVVKYPLKPLMNQIDRTLTTNYRKALTRIFRVLDQDNDGRLNDAELNALQERVFDIELSDEDLRGLKDVIREDGPEHFSERGINMEGYYILYKRMLDMMKIKNCWQILRNFNYSDNLTINEAYFDDSLNGIGQGSSVELSNTTAMFLRKLFSLYSKNGSNLVLNDLNSIFFPCEDGLPSDLFKKFGGVDLNEEESLSKSEWFNFWSHLTFKDYQKAYTLLTYIGLEIDLSEAFIITNHKSNLGSMKSTIKRQVLNIAFVGDQRVGKSSIIDLLSTKEVKEKTPTTTKMQTKSAEVMFPSGDQKIVIMTEIPTIELQSQSPELIETDYDLVVACFEHPNDLKRFLEENFKYLPKYVPRIGLHCKCDREDMQVFMGDGDNDEIAQFGIRKVVESSARKREVRDLLSAVYGVIQSPELGLTGEEFEELKNFGILGIVSNPWFLGGAGCLVLISLGLFIFKRVGGKVEK